MPFFPFGWFGVSSYGVWGGGVRGSGMSARRVRHGSLWLSARDRHPADDPKPRTEAHKPCNQALSEPELEIPQPRSSTSPPHTPSGWTR